MKRVVTGAIVLWSLFPAHSSAQRVFIHAGSGTPTGFSGNFGLPPVGPIPPLGLTTPGFSGLGRNFNRFGFGGFGGLGFGGFGGLGFGGFGYGFPGFYGGYGGDYGEAYQSAPNVIVLVPQQEGGAPQPPPEPARPEIREYKQPESAGTQTPAAFSIVSRDGMVRPAAAVWVQAGVVNYITPDGADGELPLASVDREATRRANAEKQLTLQLPVARGPAPSR
jgi:hypothetical protein